MDEVLSGLDKVHRRADCRPELADGVDNAGLFSIWNGHWYDGFNPEFGVYVNYPSPKGDELLVFASTEPLVLTQQNREA